MVYINHNGLYKMNESILLKILITLLPDLLPLPRLCFGKGAILAIS